MKIGPMSATSWAWEHLNVNLTSTENLVLLMIARALDDAGADCVQLSEKDIAKSIGCSLRSVVSALRVLRVSNLVLNYRRFDPISGHRDANAYAFQKGDLS